MDRFKQKSKKDKQTPQSDKSSTDAKTMKENMKIRDILRNVKMNSSMRMKAPRGSKVIQNNYFNDIEDISENSISDEGQDAALAASATNAVLNDNDGSSLDNFATVEIDTDAESSEEMQVNFAAFLEKAKKLEDSSTDFDGFNNAAREPTPAEGLARNRKLSLDQTMLNRPAGLSQSEVDLHTLGKDPLERKSSFFRKKMDSFLRNTTEIFKRQSVKSSSGQSVQQPRASNSSRKSVSMHALNENSTYDEEVMDKFHVGSETSLRSVTSGRSDSSNSTSVNTSELVRFPNQSTESIGFSHIPETTESQYLDVASSLLNTRATSMNSGLDTANKRKRKTSKSNRVTWHVSESLADYFGGITQHEKNQAMPGFQPEYPSVGCSSNCPKGDSKGRRLSYMRAVSGEDPQQKYQDSLRRKKSENEGAHSHATDLTNALQGFVVNGIPPLSGYSVRKISDEATAYLAQFSFDNAYDLIAEFFSGLPKANEKQHAAILELVYTEVNHIRHLKVLADVYLAAAHALQDQHLLLDLATHNIFLNIPDLLNSNMLFWDQAIFPMLRAAKENNTAFDTSLMVDGFMDFHELFESYESYVHNQATALDQLRIRMNFENFVTYLTWCNQHSGQRLQLADLLIKPLQRLTKYGLLINRLAGFITDEAKKKEMESVESFVRAFTLRVNRGVRQREEIAALKHVDTIIKDYEPEFFHGEDELARTFRMFQELDLTVPMLKCSSTTSRCLIYEGDLHFRDRVKGFDARIYLFTDFLIVCRKYTKNNKTRIKTIRPRYFLTDLVAIIRPAKGSNDSPIFYFVVLDQLGLSRDAFALSEPSKDPNGAATMRAWEQKLTESFMTYELCKWYFKYPVTDLAVVEGDYNSDDFKKTQPETHSIERKARERTAAMMHTTQKSSRDSSQEPEPTESERQRGPKHLHDFFNPKARHPDFLRRNSSLRTTSRSQSSQHLSSGELYFSSLSAYESQGSHEDIHSSLQRSGGSSMDQGPGADEMPPSITVNAAEDKDCETLVPARLPTPPLVVLQSASPNTSPGGPMSVNGTSQGGSENTLRVSPSHSSAVIMSSLSQDLSTDVPRQSLQTSSSKPLPHAASMILYQKHQEKIERSCLAAGHQYLSPDHRGTSYPPPSSSGQTRGSLKRGLAFNYSVMNPRLTRSQNIEPQFDVPTFADTIFKEWEPQASRGQRTPSPSGKASLTSSSHAMDLIEVHPGTSKAAKFKDKQTKKKTSILSRSTDAKGTTSEMELLTYQDTDAQRKTLESRYVGKRGDHGEGSQGENQGV